MHQPRNHSNFLALHTGGAVRPVQNWLEYFVLLVLMLLRAIGSAAPCGYYDIMMYDVQTAESGTVKRSSGRWTRRIYERRTHVGSVRCMGSGSNAGLAIRAARRKVAQMVQRRQNKNAHLYTWYSAGISDTQVPRSVIMSPTTASVVSYFLQ